MISSNGTDFMTYYLTATHHSAGTPQSAPISDRSSFRILN